MRKAWWLLGLLACVSCAAEMSVEESGDFAEPDGSGGEEALGSGGSEQLMPTGGRTTIEEMHSGGGDDQATGGSDSSGGDSGDGGSVSSGGAAAGGSAAGGSPDGVGGTIESSGGAEGFDGIPLSKMKLPAKLQDGGACWYDLEGGGCEAIPDFAPPIIEWSCGDTVAALVVPPGTCLRVRGRFAVTLEPDCVIDPTAGCAHNQPESKESRFTNTTADEYRIHYIHRRRDCELDWTAWWYAGECPVID